ncbi:MAG: aldehyde ferredoxin oxidoreductase N-terminal domain-containing protein [Desulfobacterales bacterium]
MRYAETGFQLEVDLSRGNIERVETDPRLTELHLGGVGTNARLLWERVPPEIDPLSHDNVLIFSAGLLGGTPATGANRTIVSAVSPQTRLMAFSMMGGFFAPELKYAGYDKIVLHGRSPELVYLWIHNDRVELRDARHLAGKGALETAECLKRELKDPNLQVAAIGLAGENRVYFASIEHARSSASRGGLGAVMGSKNLKAIAVRGTRDLPVARPAEFMELCREVLRYIQWRRDNPVKGVPAILAGIGSPQEMAIHDEQWHTTNFAWGNARHRRKDFWTKENEERWRRSQEQAVERLISCYNCPMKCGAIVRFPALGVSKYMMKCYSKLTYVMGAMVDDLDFGFRIAGRAQEYGVDAYTTPQVMAFAMELLDAGILTPADVEGMPEDREEKFFWLLDRIVRREGIGEVLADGVYWAARRIGRGAEAFDHNTIKKHEQIPIKLGMLNPIYFIMYATGEKINITQIEGQMPQMPFETREEREEFVRDWIQVPHERFKEFFLNWEPRGERAFPHYPPPEVTCEIVEWQEMMHYLDDSLGICAGLSSFPIKPPYHIHNLPLLVSAATGIDYDEESLWRTANRNRTLVRAVNNRLGLRRHDEKPPEDHWKKRFPELEARLIETYYRYKGWNAEGVPTRETLERLELGDVAEDLIRRGILREEAPAAAGA